MVGFNHGDVAWLLTASSMVLFMSVPGLALFYGGLVRARSVISTMMYTFVGFALVMITWVLLGFGIAFGKGLPDNNPLWYLVGNPLWYMAWLAKPIPSQTYAGLPLPIYIGFQGVFAAIATAIISSAVVERARIEAWALFAILWLLAVYSVVAHWVWGSGWIQEIKHLLGLPEALDFAGGLVVHVASGFSALMLALLLGRRRGVKEVEPVPHNIPLILIGTGILWFGWLGFNAGSALAANESASMAWLVTAIAAAAGGIAWLFITLYKTGRASSVAFASGVVAGLVAITPCAGYVGPLEALVIGVIASLVSYYAMEWRISRGIDETLDAWAVHGMSGFWGNLAVGIFANPFVSGKSGLIYGNIAQFVSQLIAGIAVAAYVMTVTAILYFVVDKLVGWRVPAEAEYVGLDAAEYGEQAYVTM